MLPLRSAPQPGSGHLLLVVYRGLGVGRALDTLTAAVGEEHLVWFTARPRATEVVRAVEGWDCEKP